MLMGEMFTKGATLLIWLCIISWAVVFFGSGYFIGWYVWDP